MNRGPNETIRRIKDRYKWAGMNRDIENMIKKCEICRSLFDVYELTKSHKPTLHTAKAVVNTLLFYFQHYCKLFDNNIMKDLCELNNIKFTFSSVNYPQARGSTKRFHTTLLEMPRVNKMQIPTKNIIVKWQ